MAWKTVFSGTVQTPDRMNFNLAVFEEEKSTESLALIASLVRAGPEAPTIGVKAVAYDPQAGHLFEVSAQRPLSRLAISRAAVRREAQSRLMTSDWKLDQSYPARLGVDAP